MCNATLILAIGHTKMFIWRAEFVTPKCNTPHTFRRAVLILNINCVWSSRQLLHQILCYLEFILKSDTLIYKKFYKTDYIFSIKHKLKKHSYYRSGLRIKCILKKITRNLNQINKNETLFYYVKSVERNLETTVMLCISNEISSD